MTVREQVRQHLITRHLTAEQVGQIARSADVEQVLLTHYAIPPTPLALCVGRLLGGIRANYSGAVHFGRDLGSIDVGCR